MMALIQLVAIGIGAALALAVPIGYELAWLISGEPRGRSAGRRPVFTISTVPGMEPAIARLGPDIGQDIARLIGELGEIGLVILPANHASEQIGVLMSIDQFELLHAGKCWPGIQIICDR